MLRIFAVALLATAMSVCLAEAKGHMAKAPPPYCQTDQKAAATCACGPAKTLCPKGMWCHAFTGVCRP